MPSSINVYFLPSAASAKSLEGHCAVVIDVLRATTTIVQALSAGADCVVPCLTVEEAVEEATAWAADENRSSALSSRLLAGERDCIRVARFDMGNSPLEYTSEVVKEKEIVFTTTNGTAAMLHCAQARSVLLAAFTNLTAICQRLEQEEAVEIICSGTNGQLTREDVLLAGAIAARLSSTDSSSTQRTSAEKKRSKKKQSLNDAARIAIAGWRELAISDASAAACETLAKEFESTLGGRNLLRVGQGADLIAAAEIDRWAAVPEFSSAQSRIFLS